MRLIILKIIKITAINFVKNSVGIELDEKRLIDFANGLDLRKNWIWFPNIISKIVGRKR